MTSWTLLQRLFAYWRGTDHPVFLLMVRRPPPWYGPVQRLLHRTGLLIAVGSGACYLLARIVVALNSVLAVIAPLIALWLMVLGLALGPTIASARERRTWEMLRLTPQPVEMLILSRGAGALWWLREVIALVAGAVILAAVGIGLISLIVTPSRPMMQAGIGTSLLCIWAFAAPLTWVLLFLADRAQQFALLIAAALYASTLARTVRGGTLGATAALFAVWLADMGAVIVVMGLLPDRLALSSDWLVLLTFGPVIGYLAGLGQGPALLAAALTLIAREAALGAVWAALLRRA